MDLLRKKAAKVHEYYKETKDLSNIEILDYLKIRHAYGYTKSPFNADKKDKLPLTDEITVSIIHSNIENIYG